MARQIQTALEQRRAREEKIEGLLRQGKPPDILAAALAAMKGEPHPRDPWNFNSVLQNQQGTPQADRFISIIRKTRRSSIVEDKDMVKAVWTLAGLPWVRTVESWVPKGKKHWSRFKSLAGHLTCKYRMPEFLFWAFFIPEPRPGYALQAPFRDRAAMLVLFEHLAGGGSVRQAVADGMLPVPLTKRMCHEFMQGPATGDIYMAIRYAQVKASGGSESLSRALAATRLGRGIYDEEMEPRLLTVIEWFSRQGMLNPDLVGPMFDYIEQQLRVLDFVITGRSVAAIQRGMEAWHAQLNRQPARQYGMVPQRIPPAKFNPSGFTEEMVEFGKTVWSVEEILSMNRLRTEGAAMRHCVTSYWPRIESGHTSIWTLQKEGQRQLTVEVDNGTRAVVQARGVCNRPATPEQVRILHHWAAKNNLRVRTT